MNTSGYAPAVVPAPVQLVLDLQVAVAPRGLPVKAFFEQAARHALAGLKTHAEFTLRLVGKRESRALNRRFRHADKPTNVLAFVADGVSDIVPDFIGDIVICVPLVALEARAQGKTRRAHFAHLAVHGLLHLLGFEHEEARAAARMEARERVVLAALGFADPYAP